MTDDLLTRSKQRTQTVVLSIKILGVKVQSRLRWMCLNKSEIPCILYNFGVGSSAVRLGVWYFGTKGLRGANEYDYMMVQIAKNL